MGDRAVVYFEGKTGYAPNGKSFYSPGIYLHWDGEPSRVLELLRKAQLRQGSPAYSAARFCYTCCKNIDPDGYLSVGLFEAPTTLSKTKWKAHADKILCDNGFYIVSCITGEVTHVEYGGIGRNIGTVTLTQG